MGYAWTRAYQLYSFDYQVTSGSGVIALSTEDKYEFSLSRSYDNAVWYPQKSVVSYNANYTLD